MKFEELYFIEVNSDSC